MFFYIISIFFINGFKFLSVLSAEYLIIEMTKYDNEKLFI